MGMVSILGSLFAPFFLIGIGISDPNVQAYPLMAMAAAGMAASSFYGFLHGRIGTVGMFRSEEHTSELQSLMRISYAVFCLQKKNNTLLTVVLTRMIIIIM